MQRRSIQKSKTQHKKGIDQLVTASRRTVSAAPVSEPASGAASTHLMALEQEKQFAMEQVHRQALLAARVQLNCQDGFWSFFPTLSKEDKVLWRLYFPEDPVSGVFAG